MTINSTVKRPAIVNRIAALAKKFAALLSLVKAAEAKQGGAKALGKQRGGFHLSAHTGKTGTFKKNRRKELKAASVRRHKRHA